MRDLCSLRRTHFGRAARPSTINRKLRIITVSITVLITMTFFQSESIILAIGYHALTGYILQAPLAPYHRAKYISAADLTRAISERKMTPLFRSRNNAHMHILLTQVISFICTRLTDLQDSGSPLFPAQRSHQKQCKHDSVRSIWQV